MADSFMEAKMLKKSDTIAIMVDMQDRLVPAIAHNDELTGSCRLLLEGLGMLDIPLIATQQYSKGLGMTLPELQFYTDGKWIEKITFSCWREPAFREAVGALGAKQVIVFGTETHICVQQTVLDMLEAGFEVYLIADCVGSRFDTDRDTAIRRMEKAGAVITTSEAALFELTEAGGTELFRAVSRLVKGRHY